MMRYFAVLLILAAAGCTSTGPTTQPSTRPATARREPPPNPPLVGPEYYPLHRALSGPRK